MGVHRDECLTQLFTTNFNNLEEGNKCTGAKFEMVVKLGERQVLRGQQSFYEYALIG